jgi:Kef-type K+ transport system membrane component KefB
VFLFLGIGEYAEATPLAALLAGIGLGNFIPEKRLELIESEVKTMCYGFFAPIFFLWVGATLDINSFVFG